MKSVNKEAEYFQFIDNFNKKLKISALKHKRIDTHSNM